jgi:translocator assembly and maintenance protein 41
VDDLIADLLHWRSLYVSGRMHKPVDTLLQSSPVAAAQRQNLNAALAVALLTIERESFSEEELFLAVAGISYRGDMRMRLGGENANKVVNIVRPNLRAFVELYRPLLEQDKLLRWNGSEGRFWQPRDLTRRQQLIARLPPSISATLNVLAKNESETIATLDEQLARIVARSSWTQSMKGLFSGGLVPSISYAAHKLKKSYQRK